MAPSKSKETAFEPSLARLEEIVQRLENGDPSLEESLKLFEEGVTLSRKCLETLGTAERKVEQLMAASGKVLPLDVTESDAP